MVVRSAERMACFSISSSGMIGAGPDAGAGVPWSEAAAVTGKDGGVDVGTMGGAEKFSGEVVPCEGEGKGGVVVVAGAGAEKVGSGSGIGGLDDAVADTGIAAPTTLRDRIGSPSAAVETGRPVSERITARSMVF